VARYNLTRHSIVCGKKWYVNAGAALPSHSAQGAPLARRAALDTTPAADHELRRNTMLDSITPTRLGTRALLRALASGWQSYLPAMSALSADDTAAYLAAQGYERVRDLLAHATAWCEETLGVVPVLLQGGKVQHYDDQAFNAQAVARFSYFSEADVERRFVLAHAALSRMLALLPEDALDQADVYDWLSGMIVDHFNEHRPPNLPPVP
jgi:hypothetical protein